ncbi:MAG: ferrous iron transport protein A [Coriobacteriia bacterium]|nr:ferrous iron transport protein A [Coriobacteriia bacterium]
MTQDLYKVPVRREYTVVSVPEIGLLQGLGIRSGTRVALQDRYAFGGPALLSIEDTYTVALGKDVASQIAVQEAAS